MKRFFYTLVFVLLPFVTFAQEGRGVRTLIDSVLRLVNMAFPIVTSLAIIAFFWGLTKYIFHTGNAGKYEEGRKIMIWGILALFVMVSLWGIVRFMRQQLNLGGDVYIDDTERIPTPTSPFPSNPSLPA